MSAFYTANDHFVLLPALLLCLFGCAILLFDFWVFPHPSQRKYLLMFLGLAEAFTGVALVRQHMALSSQGPVLSAFGGGLLVDGFSLFFNWLFLVSTLLVGLISYKYLEVRGAHHGEYYGLLLFAQSGMYFLAGGADLVTLFVGLELMAVSFYVLVGFMRADKRSNEAALKYLLLGGFSSGFLAYGFSLFYGLAGSTKLSAIAAELGKLDPFNPMVLLAMVTTSVGLFFKIAAAPFHMWAPDAYEGAPTPVTAFLAVASKAASFALLVRLFWFMLGGSRVAWEPMVTVAALLSLTVGNIAAVTQTNTKRLLAYSSVSHAGYILLGLIAGNATGLRGILIYLLVYTFMTLGAFLVITVLARQGLIGEDINDLGGLMQRSPAYAVLMLIFLLSLAGIPPTAGFIGKYLIFQSLIETGHYYLAVVGVLYVAVAIYYYFRMVKAMFTQPADTAEPLSESVGVRVALYATGLATLVIGIYPEPFLRFAQTSLGR